MNKQEIIEKLKAIHHANYYGKQSPHYDQWNATDQGHEYADEVLCDFLIELGHGDIVEEYKKITRWFE